MKPSFFKKHDKQKSLLTSLLLLAILVIIISCGEDNPVDPDDDITFTRGKGEARDISSFDLLAEMGVGWNLGNSFDATSINKTSWGNPRTTKEMIDEVAKMGFKTLRIPITWGPNQDKNAPYTIDSDYLDDVKMIVDYGFHNRMHVIINVHHDDDWIVPNDANAESTKERLSSLWTQVANHFIEYNDSLIFETLNEPRVEGIPEEWSGGTPEGRGFVNDFHETAVNAIRSTGGNNAKRHIMISTWAASTVPAAMDDLVIPNDDPKIIISLHSYFPWEFAGEASVTWGSDQDKLDLEAELDNIKQKWIIDEGRPVILGEWGTIDTNPLQSRIEYAEFYVKEATERNLLTIVWDDGGMFELFDRRSLTWKYSDIATTIVTASGQ